MKRSSPRQNFLHFTILRCLVSFDFKLRRKVWDDKVEKLEVNSIFYKYKTAIHDPDLCFAVWPDGAIFSPCGYFWPLRGAKIWAGGI